MKTQREANQLCYESNQRRHEEWLQFEADECFEEVQHSKAELQTLQDELAAQVIIKQPSLPRSGAKVPVFNLEKDKSTFYTWKEKWGVKVTITI
jgi:hypothetical protein